MSLPTNEIPTRKNTLKVKWTTMIKNSKTHSLPFVGSSAVAFKQPIYLAPMGKLLFKQIQGIMMGQRAP